MDHLYFKVAGTKQVVSMPLCECGFDEGKILYDPSHSTADSVAFTDCDEGNKPLVCSKEKFMTGLQKEVYNDQMKIVAFVIQPEGEMQTPEVTEFLEKYNN